MKTFKEKLHTGLNQEIKIKKNEKKGAIYKGFF